LALVDDVHTPQIGAIYADEIGKGLIEEITGQLKGPERLDQPANGGSSLFS
jgi:hypothetical protein